MPKAIGLRLPRREDPRFVTGTGRFTDDIVLPEAAYAYVVRSPYAHARIDAIHTDDAASAPGVLAVLTAADYRADGHRAIAHVPNPADAIVWERPGFVAPDGASPVADVPQLPLAEGRVRFAGEPVALVVAESAAAARDAAERVDIRYDDLPAVFTAAEALAPDAPALWPSVPGNCCFDVSFGDEAATQAAFAGAHLVLEREFFNQRLVSAHMEPRASLAVYDIATQTYTVTAGSQGAVKYRVSIAAALGVLPERVRVITPDVGGGFGSRTNLHPEPLLVAWAARRLARPVRWTSDRSEGFLTDYQGRDLSTRVALAFDAAGRIRGMRATLTGNLGAYTVGYAPLQNCYRIATSVYDVPVALVRARAAVTNTTPTAPFRGAGRPEAIYAIERLLDIAARRLAIDRVAIRRRNIVQTAQLPYRTAVGLTYDSGDFAANMESALARLDWAGVSARREAAAARGRLRGAGFANYIEAPVGAVRERVTLHVHPSGAIDIVAGTQSTGQGHETTFAQVVAEYLDVPIDAVRLVTGDTDAVTLGGGTHSNRSMRIVGTMLVALCAELAERARALGASGVIAAAQRSGETLTATTDFAGRIAAHPTGCAACEVEIDPETGAITIERYAQVDDCGQAINPLILDGQTHGGIAMGIGQALMEIQTVDAEAGVQGGSFMTYALPRATDVPHLDVAFAEHPTAGNPLRIKGGGEGGVTPAPAVIVNAICDALRDYGVEHLDTPVTPERVWRALQSSRAAVRLPELAARR